jgi:UDP-glucose 4-epimerase
MSAVLVTGSSGYIGGQTILNLRDSGHTVFGIDRREPPPHLRGVCELFLLQDFASDIALDWIKKIQPTAIVHCAGTSLVGPSVSNPSEYFNNNVTKTLRLLDTVRENIPRTRFVFSSSAAVYGISNVPLQETDDCQPISPYGQSKLMIDQILQSYHQAYGLDFVSFRYFNACGADPQGRHGQEPGATHIIARVLESIRDGQEFVLYGDDYHTPDGTCVRDYIHVSDIAGAHVTAMSQNIPAGIYNLGSNTGTSNKQICTAAETITGQKIILTKGAKRTGDPDILIANACKFNELVNWQQYILDHMIQHAWNWYSK